MQDVVIIPTYDRPELLWLCLEYLARTTEGRFAQIRVVVDAHIGQPSPPRREIDLVLNKFPQLSLQVGYRQSHAFQGNSYNVLMAFKDAYEKEDGEFVYLIEDDVVIHPTFFVWHRWMHAANLTLGCSIGVKDPGHGAYASLGVCFRRERLAVILPHCRPAYFQNMRGYCHTYFPPSPFDCEQDGLWARVLKEAGTPTVWADIPLAQHVGWYGYHRRKSTRPHGTLDQKFAQVKQALGNRKILQTWSKDFNDIHPL